MHLMHALIAEDDPSAAPREADLLTAHWTTARAVPVIGWAGADPAGARLFACGQSPGELAPLPPGSRRGAVALRVCGQSMRGLADDGALIYFEDQRTPPTADMLGHVVVLETDGGEVLVKRLLRGSGPGLFDLESLDAPLRADVRLRWAAHITVIIPPYQARRILLGAA
jgi:phage repressor protein C with HTH and peptisase S24 domain